MKNLTIADLVKNEISVEEQKFGRAVSICSVLADREIYRAEQEEFIDIVVEGLMSRHGGHYVKELLISLVENGINTGVEAGLLEVNEDGYISMTYEGTLMGEEWLQFMNQN